MTRSELLFAATCCLCFYALIGNVRIVGADKPRYRVEQVQVVFRHGDRIPDKSEVYETDPYDAKYWKPVGYGKLTDKGRKHAYGLGEILRERYDDLVSREFNETEVFSYSTDFDRTQQSLQMVLNGLYAPAPHIPWGSIKDFRTFPIKVKHRPNFMRPIKLYCKKYRNMYERAENDPKILKRIEKHQEFMDVVRERTKSPESTKTPRLAARLLGNLDSVISMGLPIPDWCTGECYKILYELTGVHIDTYVLTEDMKRRVVGPAVKVFTKNIRLDQTEPKDDPKNKIKLFLFSGHDIGLSTISRVLRMKEVPPQPTYSSALIIEKLRDEQNNVYVRVYYYTGATTQIIPIKLAFPEKPASVMRLFKSKHCKLECPLKSYYKIVRPWLPHDDDEECESTTGTTS